MFYGCEDGLPLPPFMLIEHETNYFLVVVVVVIFYFVYVFTYVYDVKFAVMTAVLHCETIQALEETWTANMFVICLDKPESELNTIDLEFGIQFGRALYLAKEKANVGEIDVLVVCSAKEESFVAGADILLQLKLIGIEGEYKLVCVVRGKCGV